MAAANGAQAAESWKGYRRRCGGSSARHRFVAAGAALCGVPIGELHLNVVGQGELAAAERIDVETAAPGVAANTARASGRALALEVAIDALDALLVELVVLAEGDDDSAQ